MIGFGSGISTQGPVTPESLAQYFDRTARIGTHVSLITEWATFPGLAAVTLIRDMARDRRLDLHLSLSPIAAQPPRSTPGIPASVGLSFHDPLVRAAYLAQIQALIQLRPAVLGLATELNLLAPNAGEYPALVSLLQEAITLCRGEGVRSMVSFQWDVMLTQTRDFAPLFAVQPDVYGFTTFPAGVDPATIPSEFYACVRSLLPAQAIAYSEVGYPAAHVWQERRQAAFYARVPSLMAHAEWVTLALLHDIQVYGFWLDVVGIRYRSGRPKRANTVVEHWA